MKQHKPLLKDWELLLLDLLKYAVNMDISTTIAADPARLRKLYENTLHMHFTQKELNTANWELLIETADQHSVLPIIYDLLRHTYALPEHLLKISAQKSRQTVLQNYRLLFMSSQILQQLDNNGIRAILLKGWQTAYLYPIPEVRKSGDIDILIADSKEFEKAVVLLEQQGYQKAPHQLANHHIELIGIYGISIEVHSMLTEPLEDESINQRIDEILLEYNQHILHKEILGYPIFCVEESYDAYYLLLHMLQHFLRAGFGLKLLCDWCVFWKRNICKEQKKTFLRLVQESHLENFAKAITSLCVLYLGLSYEKVSFLFGDKKTWTAILPEQFQPAKLMKDILEAEEFGHSQTDRMVVLQNSHSFGYFKAFHHQMKLNNPHTSKYVILWPYLWCRTLIVFLINNRRIRKTTVKSVLKKTKTRSRLIHEMNLFKK